MPEMNGRYQWQGRTLIGSDGHKIGKVSQIYEDPTTGNAEWATVSSGLFGTKSNFVPLAGASPDGEDIRADVTKAQVRGAPGVADDDDLSEPEERRLFEYYGVPYASEETPPAQDSSPQTGADEVDRPSAPAQSDREHEGRDVAGSGALDQTTRPGPGPAAGQPEGGRRRLRRYVVTEVTTTVPVSDEETEIEGGSTDSTRR